MSTPQQHQFMHGKQQKQEEHSHDHGSGHNHESILGGFRAMGLLGVLPIIAHDQDWLSNYRPTRLLPASNRVILLTILVLVVGVVLWHIVPLNYNGIALAIIAAAVVHLLILVIGGLSIALFMRQMRGSIRNAVINSITWRGTEQVLDVGCGTGMLLNGCARQLTSGHAIGIDLWREKIAGSRTILVENARAEGVADKIEYREMDARDLTFEDASFEVVVSSAALHHIGTERKDREQAIGEMIRVLKSGGYLALVDVNPMIDIAESVMAQAGLQIVHREQKRFFRLVTARKV